MYGSYSTMEAGDQRHWQSCLGRSDGVTGAFCRFPIIVRYGPALEHKGRGSPLPNVPSATAKLTPAHRRGLGEQRQTLQAAAALLRPSTRWALAQRTRDSTSSS